MHDLMCFVRLVETPALPEPIKEPLFDKLKRIVQHVVRRDPAQWADYGLQPLGVVSSPQAPFSVLFQTELEANLDYMIDQLDAAGCWKPNWSWGGQWPAAWAEAESDWRAVLTLANLCTLRAFGWLE